MSLRKQIKICILLSVTVMHFQLQAEEHNLNSSQIDTGIESEIIERDYVSYPASFFNQFQPITAVDMVNQVPGFQLANNNNNFNLNNDRGFSETAGNVLIDDRRPSIKRDSLVNILSRIPASAVERIELIRGQVRSIDLRGQSTVVNLILRDGVPAAIQWEAGVRKTFGHGVPVPQGNISLTDTWNGIDFNIGFRGRRHSIGRIGTEDIVDSSDNLIETRSDKRNNRNTFIIANLNTSSWWGDTFVQLNTNFNYADRRTFTNSQRRDELTNSQEDIFFDNNQEVPAYEFGLDLERNLSFDLLAKGIFLYANGSEDISNLQINNDVNGNQTLFREATGGIDTQELIGRLEIDWNRFNNHFIQANMERVYNVLDSNLEQTDDTGTGPIIVDVPGANSRVEEIRWDFLLKDTWLMGWFELEFGLGVEASTITQTGDADLERDFFFLKPQIVFNYSSVNSNLTRLRIAREVAQLDLEDFVSATEFLDDDIALGNPNIKPDATWKLELSQEKRFGGKAVIKLTAFHHWISDVLDLLPLSPTFEAPGNIGNGRRWGLLGEGTVPLDWMGLTSAKLDIKLRWQDSTVVDPVTGENRVLSIRRLNAGPIFFDIENKYAFKIDYRQDFQVQQVAWGWSLQERGKQLRFKVNELENYNEGMGFRGFIETTRWFGIKTRLTGENLLNYADIRDRRIFTGERDLSPLASRQFRDRTRGVRLLLSFSGNF